MIRLKGYIFSRKINGSSIPQHIQNIVLRDYCQRLSYKFILSDSEYSLEDSYHVLDGILKKKNNYDGIIFYSIYQLPSEINKRNKILDGLIKYKKEVHFAQENYKIITKKGIVKINNILDINLNLSKNTTDIKYLKDFINKKN